MQFVFQVFGFSLVILGIFGFLLMTIDIRLRKQLRGYFIMMLCLGIIFRELGSAG